MALRWGHGPGKASLEARQGGVEVLIIGPECSSHLEGYRGLCIEEFFNGEMGAAATYLPP